MTSQDQFVQVTSFFIQTNACLNLALLDGVQSREVIEGMKPLILYCHGVKKSWCTAESNASLLEITKKAGPDSTVENSLQEFGFVSLDECFGEFFKDVSCLFTVSLKIFGSKLPLC